MESSSNKASRRAPKAFAFTDSNLLRSVNARLVSTKSRKLAQVSWAEPRPLSSFYPERSVRHLSQAQNIRNRKEISSRSIQLADESHAQVDRGVRLSNRWRAHAVIFFQIHIRSFAIPHLHAHLGIFPGCAQKRGAGKGGSRNARPLRQHNN